MTHRRLLSFAGMLLSTVMLGSCGDPVGLLPPGLAILSGDKQSGVAGQPLPEPLLVTVADGTGRGVEGAQIYWEVTTGAGTIPFITYTDATGTASATWTLGVEGLTQTARASVSMLADSSPGTSPPVIFTATANGAATQLAAIGGNSQTAIIDDTLPVPLRVRAVNLAGSGVPGARVLWATADEGQVLPKLTLTDAQGEAVATWVLGGTVGVQTATAAVTGLNGSPRTFTATADRAANTLTWASEQLSPCYGPGAGIWASSPADVFAVCGRGMIWHFNGSSWEAQSSGTTRYLWGVWGSSPSDVFAVGDSATILHYDGTNWRQQPAARTGGVWGSDALSIGGVWGSSATDVFAVGFDSRNSDRSGYVPFSPIWHYDGTTWTQAKVGGCFLLGVWESSSANGFAVGDGVFHYDGATWNSQVPGNCTLPDTSGGSFAGVWVRGFTGVWGSGPADVYTVGHDWVICGRACTQTSTFIDHYDGTSWQRQLSLVDCACVLIRVWAAASPDVVVVGSGGRIFHYDGSRWRRESTGTTQPIFAVAGSGARDVWAITPGGLVLHGTR